MTGGSGLVAALATTPLSTHRASIFVSQGLRPSANLHWPPLLFLASLHTVYSLMCRSELQLELFILLSTPWPFCMSRILPLQIPCFYDRRRNNSNWGGFSWSDVGCHTAGRAIENDVVQWQDMSVESAWYPGSFAESLHWPRLSVVTHLGCVWYHVDLQLNLAFVFLCFFVFWYILLWMHVCFLFCLI